MGKLLSRVYLDVALRLRREEGQTLVEYALIAVLVAVALTTALGAFKDQISGALDTIGKAL